MGISKKNTNYNFSLDREPTDEELSTIFKEAAAEVRRKSKCLNKEITERIRTIINKTS